MVVRCSGITRAVQSTTTIPGTSRATLNLSHPLCLVQKTWRRRSRLLRQHRIAESAFYFTRQLAAGSIAGLESYKVEKVQYGRNPKPGDYPITERVVEAFKEFVHNDSLSGFTPTQLDEEMDFVKLRLREEIITAGFSNDAGTRVLLDSDPQVLRAIEALPDAKRLAESARGATSQS